MEFEEKLQMKKAMDILNSKLNIILPDLMSSNNKLVERLKNKLKVSTLFNNIEHRNRKYFKGFINSSNKRANFLKTGLDMKKALKQSNKNTQLLCKQMNEDLILRNMDLLLSEKKLISENTEPETHLKINNLLTVMKKAIKPPLFEKYEEKTENKVLTEDKIDKIKEFLGNEIIKEQKGIKNKINNYVNIINSTLKSNEYEKEENKYKIRRKFHRLVDTINLKKNLKLIYYKKPKPVPIKDKESANLIRIKRLLYPQYSKKKNFRNEKHNNEFDHFLRKNCSMNNIYSINNKNFEKMIKESDNSNTSIDKITNIIDVNGKDTMQVLNKLREQNGFLTDRMEHKLKRVNSLIENKLPYLSNYENILNYFNRKNKNIQNNSENIKNDKMIFSPITDKRNNKSNLRSSLNSKLISLKGDIQNINHNNELFKKMFFENKKMTIYNRLKDSLDKKDINKNKNYKKKEFEISKDNNNCKKRKNVFITEKK